MLNNEQQERTLELNMEDTETKHKLGAKPQMIVAATVITVVGCYNCSDGNKSMTDVSL